MSIDDQLARAQQQLHDGAAKIHNQRGEIVRLETARLEDRNALTTTSNLYHELRDAVTDRFATHEECVEAVKNLNQMVETQRQRLAVKCEHPNVESCVKLWQADTDQRQLASVSPELAEEFPWGCDTVEHLAAALVASRNRCRRSL